jgi:hypothetical protein
MEGYLMHEIFLNCVIAAFREGDPKEKAVLLEIFAKYLEDPEIVAVFEERAFYWADVAGEGEL